MNLFKTNPVRLYAIAVAAVALVAYYVDLPEGLVLALAAAVFGVGEGVRSQVTPEVTAKQRAQNARNIGRQEGEDAAVAKIRELAPNPVKKKPARKKAAPEETLMRTVFLIVALVLALIAMALGFGWFDTDGDPRTLGWLSAALASFVAAHLVAD